MNIREKIDLILAVIECLKNDLISPDFASKIVIGLLSVYSPASRQREEIKERKSQLA